jgi:hypothetical protein
VTLDHFVPICFLSLVYTSLGQPWLARRRRRPGGRREQRRRRRPERRQRRRAKAPRMSGLGGSSPPRVVQGLSLLLQAFMYLLLNYFCCKYILNLCEQLNMICICMNMI